MSVTTTITTILNDDGLRTAQGRRFANTIFAQILAIKRMSACSNTISEKVRRGTTDDHSRILSTND